MVSVYRYPVLRELIYEILKNPGPVHALPLGISVFDFASSFLSRVFTSEPIRAFLRHAFGCFYDAFSQIDLANKPFIPTLVFHETLLSFRSAVLRYAYTIRLLYIKRRFTSKKLKTPPEEARKRFAALLPSSPSTNSTTDSNSPQRSRKHSTIKKQQ